MSQARLLMTPKDVQLKRKFTPGVGSVFNFTMLMPAYLTFICYALSGFETPMKQFVTSKKDAISDRS